MQARLEEFYLRFFGSAHHLGGARWTVSTQATVSRSKFDDTGRDAAPRTGSSRQKDFCPPRPYTGPSGKCPLAGNPVIDAT
jgi:hypothetical protein